MTNKRRAEDDEEEELTKLLESFTKEQLIDIIRSVSMENTQILEEILKRADQNPFRSTKSASKALKEPLKNIGNQKIACELASSDQQQMNVKKNSAQRKIFVGNVSSNSEITAEELHKFFSKFGEIERGPLGFDKDTGKPKGYALFIYKTAEGATKALEKPIKKFNGYILHCAISTGGGCNNRQKTSSGTGLTKNQTLNNDGCDSAATAPTTMQPAAGASEMRKSVCQLNTSHQTGPSGHVPTSRPALARTGVCIACIGYYLKQFVLLILCLVGVLFLLSRVF